MTECRRVIGSTTLHEALRRCRLRGDGWLRPWYSSVQRKPRRTFSLMRKKHARSRRAIDNNRGFLPINFSPLTRCTLVGLDSRPLEEDATVCRAGTSKGEAKLRKRLFDCSRNLTEFNARTGFLVQRRKIERKSFWLALSKREEVSERSKN